MSSFGGPDARERALAEIARYSISEAASLVGALCLIPQNLHRLGRLESIAHCCLASVPSGSVLANRTNVARLLAAAGEWVGHADDPADFVATEAFTFHGGTHTLIGPSPLSAYAMRLIGDATLVRNGPAPTLQKRLSQLFCLLGTVSNRLAERAGLRRNLPMPSMDAGPFVPHGERMRALQQAVVYSAGEWNALLARFGLRDEDLERVIARPKQGAVDMFPYLSKALGTHPLVRTGTETVVVAPHRIADAACCEARLLIVQDESHEEFASLLHAMACSDVQESLRRLHLQKLAPWTVELSSISATFFAETVFAWDVNRLAHVVVVSDACEASQLPWEPSDALQRAVAGRAAVEATYVEEMPHVEEVFTLLVLAPLGGAQDVAFANVEHPPERLVVLSAYDLQTICLGTGDADPPRFLGRYARARQELATRGCLVQAWSELDVVAAWRDGGHRFPFGPTHMAITCDHGGSLREAALANTDRHAVPGPHGGLVEVEIAEDATFPIYGRIGGDPRLRQVVVEVFDRFLWFELPLTDQMQPDEKQWAVDCLRMCAFWTAELGAEIALRKPVQAPSAEGAPAPNVALTQLSLGPPRPGGQAHYGFEVEPGRIRAHVDPALTRQYDGTNAVERAFATDLLWAVLRALGEGTRDAVEAAVDHSAPLGPKRMMHSVNTNDVPEYYFSDQLPEPLLIHEADLQRVSRWVMERSPIPAEGDGLQGKEARAWLNFSVERLLNDLRTKLDHLDIAQVLERLLLNAERLIFDLAQEEITLPSQIACHGRAPNFVARLRADASRRATASAATRFLLELIVTERRPGGEHAPGDVDVESLLAIALELMSLGATSDVIKFNLGLVRLTNDDGYLSISQGVYDAAGSTVGKAVFADQLAREGTRATVGRIGAAVRRTRGEDARWHRLSQGIQAEFGVSFEQFSSFVHAALEIWAEAGAPILVMDRTTFIARISAVCGFPEHQTTSLLDNFAMSPRDDYLAPPSPFRRSDVFPWHVNRPLSYLRRPFICGDDATVRYTGGHLHRASAYLLLLMTSGRYKATTHALKDAMSAFTAAAGAEFNEDVSRALTAHGLAARARVKTFGKKKIQDQAGRDLGDIDVLAFDDATRVIYVVECKNMSPDRAPHQVKGDLDTLFLGDGAKLSTQEKHLRRVRWVEANLDAVLQAWGRQEGAWKVESFLVSSVPLQASLLGHAKLRIVSAAELKRGMSAIRGGP